MHRPTWPTINAVPATLVVVIGAWLVWGPFSIEWALTIGCSLLLFLLWRGSTIGTMWAWSTLLLGVESLAWPVTMMVRFRSSAGRPSDEEMGIILNAVLFGLFSSVFWIAFAIGLFRRERGDEPSSQDGIGTPTPPSRRRSRS